MTGWLEAGWRLDYFGETVNIASRLNGLAQGNDVILSQDALSDPATCLLAGQIGDLFPLAARLRGLPEHFDLHRLAIARSGDKP